MTQTLTVSSNWLDVADVKWNSLETVTNGQFVQSDTTTLYTNGGYCYSYVVPWGYSWAPKIQLKLSEIERLRKAAKVDEKLKDILNKFTQHIEVLVDF